MAFLVGMKKNDEAEAIVARYDQNCQQVCERELEELISYWHGQLSHFQIKTPSNEFNTMINTWNAYNCFMTFIYLGRQHKTDLIRCHFRCQMDHALNILHSVAISISIAQTAVSKGCCSGPDKSHKTVVVH